MSREIKSPSRFGEHAPRDKPQGDRVEHANLERPGAQAHPRFGAIPGRGWGHYTERTVGWNVR